jgi:tetratricopeptide (TPR) repeat protein
LRINYRSISFVSFLLLILAVTLTSCSTKKNTFTRRAFHNLTSHYNTYWNGNEAYEEGLRELEKQIKINYTEILPVEDFGDMQQAQAINSYMDRAIEKASKVVQKHTMFFERKEQVKRVPDSYQLIGKAYFYKQDYFSARQTFEFVAQKYERQPIRFEAQLWQARTAIQLGEFERSVTLLDNLQNQVRRKDFPKDLVAQIPVVYALHYTEQKNYQEAKPFLRKAAELNRDKDFQARMYYILAQIHQEEGAFADASSYYAKVIKLNPAYEMRFSAQISMAQSFDATSGSSRQIVADLNKLLKDSKNKEYQDQIYYALAHVALRENNDTAAYRYLRASVAASVANDFQKTLSARKLADLYFAIPQYQDAYAYYDTTMQTMQFDHPDYAAIDKKTTVLSELVGHLNTIQLQDSLQMLAGLPEDARNKIVDQIIADYQAEQDRIKKEEEMLAAATPSFTPMPGRDPSRGMLQQVTGGGWYFYNPQAISFGFSDFTRKWGRRKLEDNWRLSDKRTYSFDGADMLAAENDSIDEKGGGKGASDPLKRETYLANIPSGPEQIEASNRLISEAMYQLAYVFREGFQDYPRSAATFEEFLNRFPADEQVLNAHYHLYTLYTIEGNKAKADEYKRIIIQRYPDSEYASILSDPEYFSRQEAEKRKVELLYEDTYKAYKGNQHQMVVIYSNEAENSYPDSPLLPKFAYLRALAKGGMHNQDTLIVQLKRFIASYPSSDIIPMAQSILAGYGIEGFEDEEGKVAVQQEAPSIYSFSPEQNHFFVLVVDHNKTNVDATRIRISDYNTRNYKLDNLSVNTVLIDDNNQMISVSNFAGITKAMAYYNAINESDYVFSPQLRRDSQFFVISSDNYPVFYRDKAIDTYMEFFRKHYFQK